MLRIAVTGGIACGKTQLGTLIQKSGVAVCEADDMAHRLMEQGAELHGVLSDRYGRDIVSESGDIDREKLADIVFNDLPELEKLTSFIHPAVKLEWEAWLLKESEADSDGVACVIVPLLFEEGFEKGWDAVISVVSPKETCVRRLIGKGMSNYERRMDLQMPMNEKAARADYVVVNSGSLEFMESQWNKIYKNITETKV
jgi:dephospho-CoA kinase